MEWVKNAIGHLRNIIVHKYWVMHFGRQMGVNIWRLLMHDISKFSPIEFFESVKYYQGTSSPIPACKKVKGYSNAWQHHKGRNTHHYEYWTDNYDLGMNPVPMPFECVEEMIVDWFAAGRTYQGTNHSFESQTQWWVNKKQTNVSIHPNAILLIDRFFGMGFNEWKKYRKDIKKYYKSFYSNK